MKENDIARVCHQINKALCEAAGDTSQKDWEDAEAWQRKSAREGVGSALARPEASPEDQHQAWSDAKGRAGWVFGEEKDAEAKTHPCLVPYADLPFEQKIKDYAFRAVVEALRQHL